MSIETIKIKSVDSASQGPFVVINLSDFDPSVHEPFDRESSDALASAATSNNAAPAVSEVLAARDQLLDRKNELDARELQLNQRAELLDSRDTQLNEQAIANANEAQRLADLSAALEAAKVASQESAVDPATMTKAQLQAALDAKSIKYPAAADKAELLALLIA